MKWLVLIAIPVLMLVQGVASAGDYAVAGSGTIAPGAATVFDAYTFNVLGGDKFAGFWGDSTYGTFDDPDRPGATIYEGTDGQNVTLRLFFTGVDLGGLTTDKAIFGVTNADQTDPCNYGSASLRAFWYPDATDRRTYTFQTYQIDEAGNSGRGPDRGWNGGVGTDPDLNKFDIVLEFVPVASTGEIRMYAFEKRYYSTEHYHYAPGRWIPQHFVWSLPGSETGVEDPSSTDPVERYYSELAGYPYAECMRVFAGMTGASAGDEVSWAQILAQGTTCPPIGNPAVPEAGSLLLGVIGTPLAAFAVRAKAMKRA